MNNRAGFAYMQVRLQARHGQRPDVRTWNRLQGTTDLASYLHVARETRLAPWVAGLHSTHSTHEIEDGLRQLFHDYVYQVAHWVPTSWTGSIRWLSLLPDLPAIQYLLSDQAAPAWMLNNARLRPFTSENPATRIKAMLDSSWHDIVNAWQDGQSPVTAWLEHWQALWPTVRSLQTGMLDLYNLLENQTRQSRMQAPASPQRQQEQIENRLQRVFRLYSFQPAAACAYLGLVALDLGQLRAELVTRALFPEFDSATA